MVTRYGMDAGLGHVAYEPPPQLTPELAVLGGQGRASLSEATLQRIDACGVRAGDRGLRRRDAAADAASCALLERGAALLLERETLAEDDLRELAAPLRLRNLTTDHGVERRRSRAASARRAEASLLARVEARRK